MDMLQKNLTQLISITMLLSISACAPAVLGTVAGSGKVMAEERTLGETVDDTAIWSNIKHSYINARSTDLATKVGIEVNQGRVLLTGAVDNQDMVVEAVRLAWQPAGVKQVINEIQVTNYEGIRDYTTDSLITTQVKSKLLLDKHIKSVNYNVETVAGIVYLLGVAQNQEELDSATYLASSVRGVKRVVSHMKLKDQDLIPQRFLQDPANQAPSSSSPDAPITSQPLAPLGGGN